MVANRKVSGRAMSVPAGVGIGVGVSAVISAMGAFILAWLLGEETVPEQGIGYGVMVILTIASVAGPWIAAAVVKHQRLVVCMATGCAFLLLLAGLNILCFGGQFQGGVPMVLLVSGGSAAAVLLGNLQQGSGRAVRRKRHYG